MFANSARRGLAMETRKCPIALSAFGGNFKMNAKNPVAKIAHVENGPMWRLHKITALVKVVSLASTLRRLGPKALICALIVHLENGLMLWLRTIVALASNVNKIPIVEKKGATPVVSPVIRMLRQWK